MTNNNSVVAILKSHLEAEAAVKELQRAGFDLRKLSIVERDYHTEEDVKNGKYLLIAHGAEVETVHAREILKNTNPEVLAEHQPKRLGYEPALIPA
jgi:parvulin-like peptidyl-prolyl isomerase